MSAEYDFYENPVPPGSNKKPRLHARLVTRGTTGTEQLAEIIHSRCSLSTADVQAALISLSEVMIEQLRDGNRIHIKGFGYIQMTLSCPPVRSSKEVRAESIHFKSVSFRPEIALKDALRSTAFQRAKMKNHSSKHTETDMDGLLTHFFSENPHITRLEFQILCRLTKGTANRRITKLIQAGKLQASGLARFPVYEPMPGYYGKEEK